MISFKLLLIVYYVQDPMLGIVEIMAEILIGPNLDEQCSAHWLNRSTFQNKNLLVWGLLQSLDDFPPENC